MKTHSQIPPNPHLLRCCLPAGAAIGLLLFNSLAQGATRTVLNNADSGAGSLRATIAAAVAGDTINFAAALNGQTIVLTSGELALSQNLILLGPGPGQLAISGNGSSRIFAISGGTNFIAGLTLMNGNGQFGGAIYNNGGTLAVSNCTLRGNSAQAQGGGIYSGGALKVQSCTIRSNSAGLFGGGLLHRLGSMNLQNCTIDGNVAQDGGGIYLHSGGFATVQNATLSGNFATNSGGGAGVISGGSVATLIAVNCTFTGNGAGSGGGLAGNSPGVTRLTNCIVAGNVAGTGATPGDISGNSILSASHNLIGSPTSAGGITHGLNGNIVGNGGPATLPIASILNTNLAFHGGPTLTHALVCASPAINAGLDSGAAGLPYDQRGPGFPRLLGGQVDMGAHENTVVLNANDSGPGSLRQALADVGAGGTITFAPALNGQTIVLTSGELVIDKSVTILGCGPSQLAISGNNSSRVIHITNPSSTNVLAGLTLMNGNGVGGGVTLFGGAIYNEGSTLTLSECAVRGSSAQAQGGGLYNNSGRLHIQNCIVAGNLARLFGGGLVHRFGSMTVQNSTLNGNFAQDGGGIYLQLDAIATVQNSTLSGNYATNAGGGIFLTASSSNPELTAVNCTLTGNRAGSGGGLSGSSPAITRLTNCIVAGNLAGAGSTPSDISGNSVLSASYNLIGSATSAGGITHGLNGNIVGNGGSGTLPITGILSTNLASNGGLTLTHALVTASPALNAGLNNGAASLASDQRGPSFPRLVGPRVDIGAFEVQEPILTITRGAPGQAVISWTPATPGFVLQESPSLSPPAWTFAPSGATNPITVPTTQPRKFYRLIEEGISN